MVVKLGFIVNINLNLLILKPIFSLQNYQKNIEINYI
ncbi:hypothetical protein J572_4278, partial [Acinetobacter baumannii 1499986]